MTGKVTDLEFRLYEALRAVDHEAGNIYNAWCADHPATLGHSPDDELLNALERLRDEVLWPTIYGDDDVVKTMDAERYRRNDDATSPNRYFTKAARVAGTFKVEYPDGTFTHYISMPDGGVVAHHNNRPDQVF